jgi:hypothetical protein
MVSAALITVLKKWRSRETRRSSMSLLRESTVRDIEFLASTIEKPDITGLSESGYVED